MPSIIITGASAGIGRAVAQKFISDGWQVGLLARRATLLEDVRDGAKNATVLCADVRDPQQVAAAFAKFMQQAGRLDVLFNNAGIFTPPALIDELPLEDWQAAIDVNLTGMFLCARSAFSIMRQQNPMGGRIINNGSVSAHVPRDQAVAYTSSKHAITGLTKQISLDGRGFNIACGQIDIGNAHTELLDGIIAQNQKNGTEIPHTMDVDHVASSVAHMANLPLDANVQFMTIMATKMPYIGRG